MAQVCQRQVQCEAKLSMDNRIQVPSSLRKSDQAQSFVTAYKICSNSNKS